MAIDRDVTRSPRFLPVVLALLACSDGADRQAEVARPRNVVLYLVDTLRADRLGCYGYPRRTSHNIDLLAERGTLFERNYAQGYWTVPSMISLMSGLYVTEDETALPAEYPTLAETLDAAGFTTAAFIGNRVLIHNRGFERGLDAWHEPEPSGRALTLTNRFARWYRENEAEIEGSRGFFAWIHPFDPHDPYRPRPEYRRFEGPRPGEKALRPRWRAAQARLEELEPEGERLSFDESVALIREESNLYDGEVLAVDAGVGALLTFLHEAGELERTLIVFAADHGETHCEHPDYPLGIQGKQNARGNLTQGVRDMMLAGHRGFRDEVWRTPLILFGPGVPVGERRSELTANLDLYPTILEALDVAAPPHLQGRSLWSGPPPDRDRVFAYSFDTNAVVDAEGLKLIEHSHERYLAPAEGPRPVELLDLTATPDETVDAAPDRPGTVERLRTAIHGWREAHRRSVIEETSDDARAVLLELGYVGE